MAKGEYRCTHCGCAFERERGQANVTLRTTGRLFCSRQCSYASRHLNRSAAEKRRLKSKYDRQYRERNRENLLRKKREWYQAGRDEIYRRTRERLKDPEAYAKHRACQDRCQSTPEWKSRKRDYDRRYRAERNYGSFAEAYLAMLELTDEINERATRQGVYVARGYYNKAQNRKRKGL